MENMLKGTQIPEFRKIYGRYIQFIYFLSNLYMFGAYFR